MTVWLPALALLALCPHFPCLDVFSSAVKKSSSNERKTIEVGGAEDSPAVQCELYEPKTCDPADTPDCDYVADCAAAPGQIAACMAVWTNRSAGPKVLMRGCWTTQEALAGDCPAGDECVATRSNAHRSLDDGASPQAPDDPFLTYFCCCVGFRCNKNIRLNITHVTAVRTDQERLDAEMEALASRQNSLAAVAGIVGGVAALAACIFAAFYCYRRRELARLLKARACARHHQHTNGAPKFGAQETPGAAPVQLIEMVARGRFGEVWRGRMGERAGDVAVKVFPAADADSWVQEQEIYAVAGMRRHPNILRFIAAELRAAAAPNAQPTYWLVVAYHPKGSLNDYLKEQEIYAVAGMRRHPNILRFIAAELRAAAAPNAQPTYWLVVAYHPKGSLNDYLKTQTLSVEECVRAATGMLRGLVFLHEEIVGGKEELRKPTIVHRDFKSKNVLLKNDLTACIADFGLAMKCEHGRTSEETHGQVGTRRYMAPEVLDGATDFSDFAFRQIDVYAAALVLWEMLSRTRLPHAEEPGPYALPFERAAGQHPALADMKRLVVDEKRRPLDDDHPARQRWMRHKEMKVLVETIEEMWDAEPDARITAGCAMERLAALQTRPNDVARWLNHPDHGPGPGLGDSPEDIGGGLTEEDYPVKNVDGPPPPDPTAAKKTELYPLLVNGVMEESNL